MDAISPDPLRPPPGGQPAIPQAKRQLVRKLNTNEHLVAWGRAWVSRDGRMTSVVAARTLDFIVCTDDKLVLFSIGFITRQPRRRVYDIELDRLHVTERQKKRGLELRVGSRKHRPLLLQMRKTPRNARLVNEILHRTEREDTDE
jgi:hypothetical protein